MTSVRTPRRLVESPLIETIRTRKNLKDETRRVYLRAVDDFLRFAGTDPDKNWNYAAVEDWRDKLRERGLEPESKQRRAGRPLGTHSVTVYLKGLRFAAKRYAARATRPDRIVLDFTQGVDVPESDGSIGTKKRYAIPEASAIAMLATCRGDSLGDVRDRAILTLGFRTGMRRRGMAGIRLEDFATSPLGEFVIYITLKGGRRHDVPLDSVCIGATGRWCALLRERRVVSGPFFWTVTGDRLRAPMTPADIYRTVKARARLAGVSEPVTPHVMRHSAISYMVARGVPVYRIKRITGQKSDDIISLYTTDLNTEPASSILPDDLG